MKFVTEWSRIAVAIFVKFHVTVNTADFQNKISSQSLEHFLLLIAFFIIPDELIIQTKLQPQCFFQKRIISVLSC